MQTPSKAKHQNLKPLKINAKLKCRSLKLRSPNTLFLLQMCRTWPGARRPTQFGTTQEGFLGHSGSTCDFRKQNLPDPRDKIAWSEERIAWSGEVRPPKAHFEEQFLWIWTKICGIVVEFGATQYRGGGLGGYGGLGLMPTKGIRADAALLVPLVVRGHGSLSVASTQWRL